MSNRKEQGTQFVTLDNRQATKKRCRCDRHELTAEKGPLIEKDDEGNGESDHEVRILSERKWPKKMTTMFSDLHALLPQLPPKADKSSIMDEAVRYIGNLQEELKKLQRLKEERVLSHGSTDLAHEPSIVSFNQVPDEYLRKPRLFSTICYVMEKYGANLVSTHVCSDSSLSHYMIQTQVMNGGTDEDDDDHHHHRRMKAEEAYKQAANEIILWISSL